MECTRWIYPFATVNDVTHCLKAGADPNARFGRKTPLHWAASYNSNPAVIVALVKAGADPNGRIKTTGDTPLHLAALSNKNSGVVRANRLEPPGEVP